MESFGQAKAPFYSQAEFDKAVAVHARHQKAIMETPGVHGVGIGEKNGNLAIVILVDDASRKAQLAATIESMPTDVRVVGRIHAHQCGSSNPRSYYPLPVPLGVSGGNALPFSGCSCASGTIGFKVDDVVVGARRHHAEGPGNQTINDQQDDL